ncbi:MAG TPA: Ig-like domain-containing protein, partial [Vicinamibacterales bacterium]|nr:Ig-like domain-containing protein [Vicinamibacterales bacterium]
MPRESAATSHVLITPDDTYLNLDGTNYSQSDILATYTWPDNQVANAIVMKFNLSAVPVGAVVTGAALHLALVDADRAPEPTYSVGVHKILHGNPVVRGANGLTRDGSTPWTPNACCFSAFPLAQSDISAAFDRPAIDKAPGFKSWTVTSMVREWLADPSSNFGLLLNSDTGQLKDRYRMFASAENANVGLRPYLAVAYETLAGSGDSTRPRVMITSPAGGATVSGAVPITATASDNIGVAGVRFLVDGQAVGAEDTSAPYGVTWDASNVPAGSHALTAVARDAAGNTRTSFRVSVKVVAPARDTTPPAVSISQPAGGSTVSGAVNITATASDNVGVVGVQFQCDGTNLGAEVTAAPYSLSWSTVTATNGTHTLTAVARDAAGNTRSSAAVSIVVNNVTSGGGGGGEGGGGGGNGGGGGGTAVFSSNWSTGTGNSATAVGDGGRWPNVWEFNGGSSVQLLSVVSGGPSGHNALRVQQRGSSYAANVQIDNALPQSTDFYVRYYMRNDDTSSAGDHIVTADTYQYANLTYMRKMGGPTGWDFVISLYGCGYTYPIGHWGPSLKLQNGAWYRFEYFVDYIDATRVQVHPRVYDANGALILSDAQFRQSDFGGAVWNGRSDWTLASYYAAGHSFCVNPQFTNDFGLGNNGQYGAADTGQYWYFAGYEIRTDRWPGAIGPAGTSPSASSLSSLYPGDVGIESDPSVLFAEKFDDASLSTVFGRWSNILSGSTMALTTDVPAGTLPGS